MSNMQVKMSRNVVLGLLAVLTLLALITIDPLPAGAATGDITRRFSTPERCPTGLTYDGECLWLADRRTNLLYRIDPQDGKVVQSIEAPCYQPEGLTMEGKFLWVLDAKGKMALKLNPETEIVEKRVEMPCGDPQGLAFDGKHLWVADYKDHRLYQISTEDGTTITDVRSPADDPYGLAFDGKYLWVSDRTADMIYMVRPGNGCAIVAFPSPSKFPRGLAFDGESLWNVDYQTDTLYRLKLQDSETYVRTRGKKEKLEFVHQLRNYGPGEVTSADVYLAVPRDLPSQKILSEVTYSPEPTDFLTDKWGQKVAHFHYENVSAGDVVTSCAEVDVELYKTRFFLFPERTGTLADIPEEIKRTYLCDGAKYCVNDPYMKATAQKVVGDETNCYWIARKLFNHVIKHMRYELSGGWNVAPTVLKRGSGSCSEYSFVYIALCRAAGLPARYVGSIVIRGDDASTDDVFHRWPEVYLPNIGWVPIDPSSGRGMFETPAKEVAVTGYRENRYLITTIGGGGSEYLGWDYNSEAVWKSKGPCKVEANCFAEWSPLESPKEK